MSDLCYLRKPRLYGCFEIVHILSLISKVPEMSLLETQLVECTCFSSVFVVVVSCVGWRRIHRLKSLNTMT